uniref:Uncharacterized protein n=1 Tax=Timema douglasi TaxID=61478 RepID=A0A7R8VTV3_TIMDO|nr:unnamed protein product [Timema douglasi]
MGCSLLWIKQIAVNPEVMKTWDVRSCGSSKSLLPGGNEDMGCSLLWIKQIRCYLEVMKTWEVRSCGSSKSLLPGGNEDMGCSLLWIKQIAVTRSCELSVNTKEVMGLLYYPKYSSDSIFDDALPAPYSPILLNTVSELLALSHVVFVCDRAVGRPDELGKQNRRGLVSVSLVLSGESNVTSRRQS